MGAQPDADDGRARALSEPQRPMLDRLLAADPDFTRRLVAPATRDPSSAPWLARGHGRTPSNDEERLVIAAIHGVVVAMVPASAIALAVMALVATAIACAIVATRPAPDRTSLAAAGSGRRSVSTRPG